MAEVGVKAVVQGLSAFLGDMRKINSALDGIRPRGTLLQRAFGSLTEGIKEFGASVVRVAEVALGVLLRDAILAVTNFLKELISDTIAAGQEFQILEMRLKRLNFNTLIESGMDYNAAMAESIRLTKEQLTWIQKLAIQTPYDASDIARTFTLARSYSFTDQEARKLTQDIGDFASGMGLTSEEMERVIVNFGQLRQQGKLNARELTDLARGAFVPINDILGRMAINMGITTTELDNMRQSGKDGKKLVEEFFVAFSDIVEERFTGAAKDMARTFGAAVANVKDLVKSIFGLNVVKPILDVLGGRLADFVDAFTEEERWNRLVAAATRVGDAIADIVNELFGLLPSTDSIADAVVGAIENIATWIEEHKDEIIGFFEEIGRVIREEVIPFIQNKIVPIFQTIADWVTENKETILGFFSALGDIIATVFTNLLGGDKGLEGGGGGLQGFLDGVARFMQFVVENKDAIAEWATNIIKAFLAFQVIATIVNVIIGFLITLGGIILTVVAVFGVLSVVAGILGVSVGGLVAIIVGVVAAIGLIVAAIIALGVEILFLITHWDELKFAISNAVAVIQVAVASKFEQIKQAAINAIVAMATNILQKIAELRSKAIARFEEIRSKLKSILGNVQQWIQVGLAIINGIITGVKQAAAKLAAAAVSVVANAVGAVKDFLGAESPSKLFEEIGQNTIAGMIIGIEKMTSAAVKTMADAVGNVAMPALQFPAVATSFSRGAPAQVSNSYQTTNNLSLTVNSRAATEPIIQDFRMLQSLQG